MARIVLGSYMVRFPLGGTFAWGLQWLLGLQRLGHEVYFVEKSGWPNSCYDPARKLTSDDCSYGTGALHQLLSRFGLGDRWCFVDASGKYHGLPRARVEPLIASADVFIDMGTHGDWLHEAELADVRVLVDYEPGFTQMKMVHDIQAGRDQDTYDYYYSVGQNIGTEASTAPTAGRAWRHVLNCVVPDLFAESEPPAAEAAATTVMNWQSYEPVRYNGREYGLKDREFEHFFTLPAKAPLPVEVAVSGRTSPVQRLRRAGWRVRDAQAVTVTFDSFCGYLAQSRAEFSVSKSGFVQTNSGWFGERSGAYLAMGRPVVLQDTGFSSHLPCGRGLFAVRSVQEAADALSEIASDYEAHSRAAAEIAREHLDATQILAAMLDEL